MKYFYFSLSVVWFITSNISTPVNHSYYIISLLMYILYTIEEKFQLLKEKK